jgi:hypothetical protein
MSDLYQSTNKLADNPYPERSHLLLEGIVDVTPAEYVAFGGGSWKRGQAIVDITPVIKVGDRNRGYPPETLEAKAWLNISEIITGFVYDVLRPVGFVRYDSSGVLQEWSRLFIQVQSDKDAPDFTSTLYIENYVLTAPINTASFSYKVYNTLYQFTDVV